MGLDAGATAEFFADGRLEYTIPDESSDAKILLTYRIDGAEIVTNQPSAPAQERTGFVISDDSLRLSYDGALAMFQRRRP
jgi:hypothetical protein